MSWCVWLGIRLERFWKTWSSATSQALGSAGMRSPACTTIRCDLSICGSRDGPNRQSRSAMGDVRQLRIDGCRFHGPFKAAIEFSSDIANADVSIRHCLFHKLATGIWFSREGQDIQRVHIINNTFHRVQHGLVWKHMPQAGELRTGNSSQSVRRNHGANHRRWRRGSIRTANCSCLTGALALNNWTDSDATSAARDVDGFDLFLRGRQRVQNLAFASTDPGSSGFLRPITPSITIEVKSAAPEADPNVGAIRPQ